MTTKSHHDDAKDKAHKDTKEAEAPKAAPERSYRDPLCAEQARHRPNCDCVGEARKAF